MGFDPMGLLWVMQPIACSHFIISQNKPGIKKLSQ